MNRFFIFLFFLMVEMGCQKYASMEVIVRNPSVYERKGEIVEVSWRQLATELVSPEPGKLVVYDADNREIASQVIYRGSETPVALIFQVTVESGKEKVFYIKKGQPAAYKPLVYGRLVPERKDDFAWENKLVAYRMYGPALEATGEISNGIDIWSKCTDELVLEEWYKKGDYHRNHGKGMDGYKVGRTLGGGAMAPLLEGKLVLGNNFISYRILDQGPLRIRFLLDYAPYLVGQDRVSEQREISLDADSRFCRILERYTGLQPSGQVAAGIVLREQPGEFLRDPVKGVMGYWEPENWDNAENNGHIGVGIIFPQPLDRMEESEGHLLAITTYQNKPVEYYLGSAWSLGGMQDAGEWFEIIKREKEKLENPLIVRVGK